MRTVVDIYNVHTFDELSDEAKDTARRLMLDVLNDWGFVTEAIEDGFTNQLENNGWEVAEVSFSLGYSQGDYATFKGTRFWEHEGTVYELAVDFRSYGASAPMSLVDVTLDGEEIDSFEVTQAAQEYVEAINNELFHLMREIDESYDDLDYVSEFAQTNDFGFLVDGSVYQG